MVDLSSLLDEIFKGISAVRQTLLPIGIVLVIGGLLFAFFGRKIFNFLLFLIGGSLAAGAVALYFGVVGIPPAGPIAVVLLAIGAFVLGGFLFYFVFYLFIFSIGASVGTLLSLFILKGDVSSLWAVILTLILACVFGGIAMVIFQITLAISSAITGAYVTSIGLFILTGNREDAMVFGVIFAIAGALFQIFLLDAFAESFNRASGNAFDGLLSRLPFRKQAGRAHAKTKSGQLQEYREKIDQFSIEKTEEEFASALSNYKAGTMSQHGFEDLATKILDNLSRFTAACDHELKLSARGIKVGKTAAQIEVTTQRKNKAGQVTSEIQSVLSEVRRKGSASYIT